jgi:hypothetical protein
LARTLGRRAHPPRLVRDIVPPSGVWGFEMHARVGLAAVLVALSACVSATMLTPMPAGATGSPNPPTNVAAQSTNGAKATVSWQTASGPVATSFVITAFQGSTQLSQGTCYGPCRSYVVSGLTVGTSYTFSVVAANASGSSSPTTSAPLTIGADNVPAPPTAVTVQASSVETALTVSWQPASTGQAADSFGVVLHQNGQTTTPIITCLAPCSSQTFRGLPVGAGWTGWVLAVNSRGPNPSQGVWVGSNTVTVSSWCSAAAVCVSVNATLQSGPASSRAQGFLQGLDANTPTATVGALSPKWWRLAAGPSSLTVGSTTYPGPGYSALSEVASFPGLSVTNILDTLWNEATYNPYRECPNDPTHLSCFGQPAPYGGAIPQWLVLSQYQAWVTAEVHQVMADTVAQGLAPVTYWDLSNEPGFPSLYDGADQNALTVSEIEQMFLTAYTGVKQAVVPPGGQAPKIVCPSLGAFYTFPGENGSHVPDMPTLLNFFDANNIKCDAISWHENDSTQQVTDTNNQPQIAVGHVTQMRTLLAEHPNLGSPLIFVNEYGRPNDTSTYYSAGWIAGEIGAMEEAGVDQANTTCTGNSNIDPTLADCFGGRFDALFTSDTGGTRPGYWVHYFYGGMNGSVVTSSSSTEHVSAFATRYDSTSTVKVLVGRHDTGAAESVDVAVTLPWAASSVTVGVQQIPDGTAAISNPSVTTTTLTPVNGVITVPLSSVAVTDAYTLTLTKVS